MTKILTDLLLDGTLTINSLPDNVGKILTVSAADGKTISSRTSSQMLSDIGAISTSHVINSITSSMISGWSDAFNWGNHAGLYAPSSGSANYIQNQRSSAQYADIWIQGNFKLSGSFPYYEVKPSAWASSFYLLSGINATADNAGDYTVLQNPQGKGFVFARGVVNDLTISPTGDAVFSSTLSALGGSSTDWNTAFGWGDHASRYLPLEGGVVSGDIIPDVDNVHSLGSITKMWRDVYIGPGSLYVNGKKVIEDVSDTMNITTSLNQNLSIKTSGTGTLQISALGSGNVEVNAMTGLIQLKGSVMFQAGKLIRTSDGTPLIIDDDMFFSAGTGIVGDLNATGVLSATGGNSTNWNAAFGWGNHASKYPTYTGVGATGTWGINISGNSATTGGAYAVYNDATYGGTGGMVAPSSMHVRQSYLWNGRPANDNTYIDVLKADRALLRNGETGEWHPAQIGDYKSWLGLGSAAYLNASINSLDNTVVQRSNDGLAMIKAGYFEMNQVGIDTTTLSEFVTTTGGGVLRRNSISSVKQALGIGAAGDYLPLAGGTLTGKLNILEDGSTFIINPHTVGVDLYSSGNIASHYQSNVSWYTGEIGAGVLKATLDTNGNFSSATGTKIGFSTEDSFILNGFSTAHYGISSNRAFTNISGYGGVSLATAGQERLKIQETGEVTLYKTLKLDQAMTGTNSYYELNRNVIGTENMFLWKTGGAPKWYLGQRQKGGSDTFSLYCVGTGDDAMYFSAIGNVTFRNDVIASYYYGNGIGLTGHASSLTTSDRWYDGWVGAPGYNANTIAGSKSGFTYSNNAPHSGALVHFAAGGYGLQLNSDYSGGITNVSYRTQNGDAGGVWNSWKSFITSDNISNQKANGAIKFWSTTHPSDFYLENNWTGSHWHITSNHGSLVRVGYSDNAGGANVANSASILTGVALEAGYSRDGASISYGGPGGPQVMGNTGNAAMMSFHRAGAYAINFGLDTDNQLKVGGWSMGNISHTIMHSGNIGSQSVDRARYVYNNGVYSGGGWMEASDLGVRYAHHSRGSYGDFYLDVNFGNSLVGKYSDVRYQGIFAMGESYKLPVDGSTPGNLYGLAYTHTNVGGQSKAGLSHQLLVMTAGTTATAIGDGIWTRGSITALGDVIAYSSSDRRLKDNMKPIENPIEKILKIGGYSFDWNNKQSTYTGHDIGVSADEIESVLPELVITRDTGYKAVKYDKIVSLLIEGIKDQQRQIDALKKLIAK